MGPVIGIDLGTTYSCVASVVDGAPRVLPNEGGDRTTPSVFAVDANGRRMVGLAARRQTVTNPEGTVVAFKRLIGRSWGCIEQVRAADTGVCKLLEGPNGDVRYDVFGTVYSVPEVAAAVLTEMREAAEHALGVQVRTAVVTVPAYFSGSQRQATRDAGRIAGLEVLQVLNEPTAAALAYGFGKQVTKQVLVFDLGGGTFDVSILRINDGVFDVLATAGDTNLGGEDFDERVAGWLADRSKDEHGFDPRSDKGVYMRLKEAAEAAKRELSVATTTDINLPFIIPLKGGQMGHLQAILTRAKLEELCSDLVERTVTCCQSALSLAGITEAEVDEVIMVGGQSRMPLVHERVEEELGRTPRKGVHPDEVVALGAAVHAATLAEERVPTAGTSSAVVLRDVTPLSLGISILNDFFHVLVPANTAVPTSASHIFTTVKDKQTSVRITILQGESELAEQNEVLGEFVLTGLREAPKGQVSVKVTIDISADGIVSVRAKDLDTGREQAIRVTSTRGLSDDEIARARRSAGSDDVAPLFGEGESPLEEKTSS